MSTRSDEEDLRWSIHVFFLDYCWPSLNCCDVRCFFPFKSIPVENYCRRQRRRARDPVECSGFEDNVVRVRIPSKQLQILLTDFLDLPSANFYLQCVGRGAYLSPLLSLRIIQGNIDMSKKDSPTVFTPSCLREPPPADRGIQKDSTFAGFGID